MRQCLYAIRRRWCAQGSGFREQIARRQNAALSWGVLLAGNDRDLMESFRLLERLKERAQTIIKEMKSQRGNGIWSQVTRNKGLSCLTPRFIVLSCTSSCLRRVFLSLEKLISKDKI